LTPIEAAGGGGDAPRVGPSTAVRLIGPAGCAVVEGAGGAKVLSVPLRNGAARSLTAAEAVDLAVRRLHGFSEEAPPRFI
jgi:hypothetical protein